MGVWDMIHSLALWCTMFGCVAPTLPQTPHKASHGVIQIVDDIGIELVEAVLEVANTGPREIRVVINSHGGYVDAAESVSTIFLFLQANGVRVRCLVDGVAKSAAFWILQSCGERLATPDSELMVHEPFIVVTGQMILTMDTLASMIEELQQDSEMLASIVAPRLGLTVIAFHEKIRNKSWTFNASMALSNHSLDSIYLGTKEGFLK